MEVAPEGTIRKRELGAQILSTVADGRASSSPNGARVLPNMTRWINKVSLAFRTQFGSHNELD